MKLAIVHDDLMRKGGAEQVALALHVTFPDAPIYTLCYNSDLTYPEFKKADVRTSFFQLIAKNEKWMKLLFYPFGYWAMRLMKIKGYDKVILSSTYASKYANFEKGTSIINYCHNPFRLAWYPDSYPSYQNKTGLIKWIFSSIIRDLKRIDFKYANAATLTIVNSKVVFDRVKSIYNIRAHKIINPPVNIANFSDSNLERSNYLIVSRLEPYKKVDLVIQTFNELGEKLVVVGNGSEKEMLHSIAGSSIIFKQNLSKEEISKEYASAKALIFPQEEDFGITPLEANASGTPVIAYSKGGILETMIPFDADGPNPNEATAVFFDKQDMQSLKHAINIFERNNALFKKNVLKQNAARFSIEEFSAKMKDLIISSSN